MRRRRVPFIQQMEYSECGLACLAMLLNYYRHHIDLNQLREEYPAPRGGYSLFNLVEIAHSKQLETEAFRSDAEDLRQLHLPAIIHWEGKHFILLEKVHAHSYTIIDPAKGRQRITENEFIQKFTGYIVTLKPSPSFETKKATSSSILLNYLKKYKWMLFNIFLFTLGLQAVMVSIPLFTKWFMDQVVSTTDTSFLSHTGLMLLLMLITYVLINGLRSIIIAFVQTRLDRTIMEDFMDTLLHLPFPFFDNRSNGDILFRANSNIYIRDILSTTLITLFIDLLLLITYSAMMVNFSLQLSLVLVGTSALLGLALFLNSKVVRKMVDSNIRDKIQVQSTVTEMVYNTLDIKVLGIEDRLLSKWQKKYESQLHSTQKLNIWESIIQTFTSAIQVLLPLLILWLGAFMVLRGEITMGTLLAFSSIAGSFISPVISISNNYTELVSLKSYFSRIQDVLKTKKEQEQADKLIVPQQLKGKIEFRNVSFKYNRFNEEVIKNISFVIHPGESAAIVGHSGSGKSTIAKLLLGLNKPTSGQILIDDIPIEQYNLVKLRALIGSVLQEAQLFNGTIKENIQMSTEASDNEVIQAAQQACIYNEIMSTPLGFDTIVTESGANFSGGQRQRLLLARALVSVPKVLILDEATSSLDNISEMYIKKSISKQPCTKLIIAHRLDTIQDADKILLLHDGQIIEEGDHASLIHQQGHYYDLYVKKGEVV
ncbi:peptidase domain-containing ABC transporter [Paenibacillus ihumii]|uniref:peptidase domain-containing ABC transporter n=1 Tax=Paenibacillus ihumii TaxID=687436 RepID=UPI0006D781DA|nr:peptidase domain-containing ABC transporter [Paenibacillus ihumii]